MKKQIINQDNDWASVDTAYSETIVVSRIDCKEVYISGLTAEGENLKTQTERILEQMRDILEKVDGSLNDVVRVRVYVNTELDDETLEICHKVRNKFFSDVDPPASTLIEVKNLVSDNFLIEFDADAIVPEDEWDTEKL